MLTRSHGRLIAVSLTMTALLSLPLLAHPQTSKPKPAEFPKQNEEPPSIKSPEVMAGNRVTFRLRAPNAQLVSLKFGFLGRTALPMLKDAEGIWSVTTEAVDPGYHMYSFLVDGVGAVDPMNPAHSESFLHTPTSVLYVPGPKSLLWEVNDVPHGVIHRHTYHSAIGGDVRDLYIYTPPGYNPTEAKTYPVLVLLHYFAADGRSMVSDYHIDTVLDNLIARKQAKPMIVVMPLAYGPTEYLFHMPTLVPQEEDLGRNFEPFARVLLTEVMPLVDANYRAAKGRDSRAVAGITMGAGEALQIGLLHPDLFGWIGAFSPGGMTEPIDHYFSALGDKPMIQPDLLWISCGTTDHLFPIYEHTIALLQSKGLKPKAVESDGGHSSNAARDNLYAFLPFLFQKRP